MPKNKPHYLGHRERLRKRFQRTGSDALHNYELLELLLTYAVPRKDVKPVAKDLITKFGSLSGVLDAEIGELTKAPGVGEVSATLIRLVKELSCVYLEERMEHKDLLTSPQAAVDFARAHLGGYPHEVFMVIYLNVKNEVISHQVVHTGTVDRAVVYPRRIIEEALGYHAASLMLIHNHPSGYSEPSEDDKSITRAVIRAARLVEIQVVDHIIVTRDGYYSFVEEGLI